MRCLILALLEPLQDRCPQSYIYKPSGDVIQVVKHSAKGVPVSNNERKYDFLLHNERFEKIVTSMELFDKILFNKIRNSWLGFGHFSIVTLLISTDCKLPILARIWILHFLFCLVCDWKFWFTFHAQDLVFRSLVGSDSALCIRK